MERSFIATGKKVLASAVSAAMVVAFTPMVALGTMTENCSAGDSCTEHEAAIGTNHYETLDEAIAAASDTTRTTVTLLHSITVTNRIKIQKNIDLNLNGKTLRNDNGTVIWAAGADVSIVGSGVIASDSSTGGGSIVWAGLGSSDTKLTIGENVTVSGSADYGVTVFGSSGKNTNLIVNGTVNTTGNGAALSGNGTYSPASITVNNGATVSCTAGFGIYFPQDGDLTINGGKVSGKQGVQMCAGEGVVAKLSNATVTATGADDRVNKTGDGPIDDGAAVSIVNRGYPGGTPLMTINGGTFTSKQGSSILAYDWNGTTNKFSEWSASTAPAVITGGSFSDFSGIPFVISGKTYSLANDTTIDSTVVIPSGVTIDLGDKTVTAGSAMNTNSGKNFMFRTSGDAVIQNGVLSSGVCSGISSTSGQLEIKNITANTYKRGLFVDNSVVTVDTNSTFSTNGPDSPVVVWGTDDYKSAAAEYQHPTLNFYGTADATGATDSYAAITGNGTDKSYTYINIYDGASLSSKGSALYLPQAGETTISGGVLSGYGAIGVKSGKLTITGGTLSATGAYEENLNTYGNGIETDGSAINVDSNNGYAGEMIISISGTAILQSTNGHAIREVGKSDDSTSVVSLSIAGGTLTSASGKTAINVRDITKPKVTISFGTFSADPASTYKVANSLTSVNSDSTYTVISGAAIKDLFVGTYTTNPSENPEASIRSGYAVRDNGNGTYTVYDATPSYVPTTPPAPAPEVGDKGSTTLPSTPGDSGTAGSTKVDVTVTDTTAATDSKGNKVDGSVSIDKIETTGTAVAIPETITTDKGTFLVTSIPAGAMEGNATATTVAIPESVTAIGEGAFSNCTALTTVTVPAGVTEIAFGTFAGCTSLETVEIQGEVTQIASNAFSGCESLTEVSIPETVTTIGSGAFSGCSSLTSASIPAGVATIEPNTFAGCTSLSTVEVAGELTEIAADAFNGCESLTSMTVAGTVRPLAAITRAASSALVIPASVTKIGDRAFKGTGITSVTVPAGVKMGTGVFRDCKQLTKATVASKVKAISAYTFKGCSALKSVTIPGTVTKIERSAFSGCKSLAKVTIPKGVTSIGKNALYGASKVKTLTVNSKKLTKSSVKGALAGSKVTTVKVPKSMLKSYAKVFAKSVVGKSVKVRAI